MAGFGHFDLLLIIGRRLNEEMLEESSLFIHRIIVHPFEFFGGANHFIDMYPR